jgi:hypothetical protein
VKIGWKIVATVAITLVLSLVGTVGSLIAVMWHDHTDEFERHCEHAREHEKEFMHFRIEEAQSEETYDDIIDSIIERIDN